MSSKFNFKELMKERHSARDFLKKEIPDETIKEILSIALASPSWCNSQPWNVYIVSGNPLEEIKKEWIKKNEEKIKGYADLQPVHRTEFSERCQKNMEEEFKLIKEQTKDPELTAFWRKNIECFNAPVIVYLTLSKGHSKWSCYDLGAFGMALMLAAKDYGIDSVVAYELAKYPDVLRKYAKIPDNEDICVGIALGYENDDAVNKFRAKKNTIDEVCHFVK
jgi:nitroreductase